MIDIGEQYQPELFSGVYTHVLDQLHPEIGFEDEVPNIYESVRSMGLYLFYDNQGRTAGIMDMGHNMAHTAQAFFFEKMRDMGEPEIDDLAGQLLAAQLRGSERFFSFSFTAPDEPVEGVEAARTGVQTILSDIWHHTNAARLGMTYEEYLQAKVHADMPTTELAVPEFAGQNS